MGNTGSVLAFYLQSEHFLPYNFVDGDRERPFDDENCLHVDKKYFIYYLWVSPFSLTV